MRTRTWWSTGQSPWVKFVELFLVANAVAAVLSLGLAPGSEDWFTWTIAPDASAHLLAVMYANAAVLGVVALRQPDWARARVLVVLITLFAIAATVMTFFNLDPFLAHPWYHLAYWLGGYAVLVATAPAVLVWQERLHGGVLPVHVPLTGLQRGTGAAAAAAMGAAALMLLASPARFSEAWPWEVAPLTARLLGVWLGAFAAAYVWALWDGDWVRARPLYLAAPVTGLLLALVPVADAADLRAARGVEMGVYYALALLIAAPGLGLLRSAARATQQPSSSLPVRAMTPGVRAGLVAIASVISLLGLSLFVLPTQTDHFFAWTIDPPLTAAFLGASYWAATALALACAAERDWVRGRAFAPPYLIAGVVLLVVTLVHLDRFHMDAVTGWAWLVLYAIFPPATVLLLVRQLRIPGVEPARTAPMPAAAAAGLALQGGAMVVLGVALVLVPEHAASLWPWPLTALTGRAIGVFVLAQGVLVLTACRERDWGRVRPAMLQYVVLGTLQLIALARFSDTLDWARPGAWLYLGFVLSVLCAGVHGARRAFSTRGAERHATRPTTPASRYV
jgi:hypothetical protein